MIRNTTFCATHVSMFTGTCPRSGPDSHVGCEPTASSEMSAPELPAPTTRTPPSRSCDGLRYVARMHLDDRRVELAGERGDPRVAVGARGDDHVVGLDPTVGEGQDVPVSHSRDPLHVDARAHGQVEPSAYASR